MSRSATPNSGLSKTFASAIRLALTTPSRPTMTGPAVAANTPSDPGDALPPNAKSPRRQSAMSTRKDLGPSPLPEVSQVARRANSKSKTSPHRPASIRAYPLRASPAAVLPKGKIQTATVITRHATNAVHPVPPPLLEPSLTTLQSIGRTAAIPNGSVSHRGRCDSANVGATFKSRRALVETTCSAAERARISRRR